MKKVIVLAMLTSSYLTAFAGENFDNMKIQLGGKLDTQFGYINPSSAFSYPQPNNPSSGKLDNHAIVNNTRVVVKVAAGYEELKYGGEISIYADTSIAQNGSSAIGDKQKLFVEGGFGKVELGSYPGATDSMKISAATLATAAGGIDGDMKYYINDYTSLLEPNALTAGDYENFEDVFLSDPNLPIGSTITSRANKITYYTPSFDGFRMGVSYAPDSEAKGTIAQAKTLTRSNDKGLGYTNLVEAALSYDYELYGVTWNTEFSYQYGHAKKYIESSVEKKRKDLNAWQIGVMGTYQGFSMAGGYIDWGRSGTASQRIAGQKYRASLWSIGAAYQYNEFATSLTYYQSKRGATVSYNKVSKHFADNLAATYNKLRMLSLGVEYKIAPGLMPYAELTYYQLNRSGALLNNQGKIFLTGVKLSF